MSPTARSKSACARLGIGAGAGGATAVAGAGVAPEASGSGLVRADSDGALAGAGAFDSGAGSGCVGALPHPLSTNATHATAYADAHALPRFIALRSIRCGDDILNQLRLAIAPGLELRQRLITLLHAPVVNALFRARDVELVNLDGLLLEREHLFLEQQVVLLERIALQRLGTLGGQQILRERTIELSRLERRDGRDFGDVVLRRLLVRGER